MALGGGSNTTLLPILHLWRSLQALKKTSDSPALPSDFVYTTLKLLNHQFESLEESSLKQYHANELVWSASINSAQGLLAEKTDEHESTVESLNVSQKRVAELEDTLDELQSRFDRTLIEKDHLNTLTNKAGASARGLQQALDESKRTLEKTVNDLNLEFHDKLTLEIDRHESSENKWLRELAAVKYAAQEREGELNHKLDNVMDNVKTLSTELAGEKVRSLTLREQSLLQEKNQVEQLNRLQQQLKEKDDAIALAHNQLRESEKSLAVAEHQATTTRTLMEDLAQIKARLDDNEKRAKVVKDQADTQKSTSNSSRKRKK